MASSSYVKRVSSDKSGFDASESPKGFYDGKKKSMSIFGAKVPQSLSMRGSNSLRGGCKTFNAMCLNGNWFEDRLNPEVQRELELFTAADNRPSHARFGPWASEYTVAYSKGSWARDKIKVAPSTIFAIDDSGPGEWTSSYRHDYKNRHQEYAAVLRKCAEEEDKRIEDARRRLRRAEEERKPEWPLTQSELKARLSSGQERRHQRQSSGEMDPRMREREEEREETNKDYNNYNNHHDYNNNTDSHEFQREKHEPVEPIVTPEDRKHAHDHHHHHFASSSSRKDSFRQNEEENDLNERMENLRLSHFAQLPPAGIPSEKARFADGSF